MSDAGSLQSLANRRIAIVAPDARSLWRLRGDLIRAMVTNGHQVLGLAPDFSSQTQQAVGALGAWTAGYPLAGDGVQPLADHASVKALTAVFFEWKPDIVIGFGLKPMLLAAIAGRRAGTARIVPMISAIEHLAEGPRARPGLALRVMMQLAFGSAYALVFHNPDDADRFQQAGLVPSGLPVHVVPGAGVDMSHFAVLPLPTPATGVVFAMIARLKVSKGVMEFCKAARLVRRKTSSTRFILAGFDADARDRISPASLAHYLDCVEWVGELDDVRQLLAQCHVFVLPSHAEGMPPALLQALAVGRPVITTNVPGCRDTVDERVNGVLVESANEVELANAMESFLKRPELMISMARASRLKAERRFDANAVHAAWFSILGLAAA